MPQHQGGCYFVCPTHPPTHSLTSLHIGLSKGSLEALQKSLGKVHKNQQPFHPKQAKKEKEGKEGRSGDKEEEEEEEEEEDWTKDLDDIEDDKKTTRGEQKEC